MRNFSDWLLSYCEYASFTEAPRRMHFWSGAAAIAGSLQRHAWFDQRYFVWFPNMYVVLVAPPGIAAKSTTASIAMELLHAVPGVYFGPNAVTGPKLVDEFAAHGEQFLHNGKSITQSALTIESGELGNLLDPQDRDLVDWLVSLWDSKTGATTKGTRGNGLVTFENPFLNILACTTPMWLEGYMPEHMIGGGFTSRCIFVHADKKEKLIAYPGEAYSEQQRAEMSQALIADLIHINKKLFGPFLMTKEAIAWGTRWYEDHYRHPPEHLKDRRFQGYLARKQTHLHKLAMVISAGRRDDLTITLDDIIHAYTMLNDVERDLPMVFDKIGRSPESVQVDRLLDYINAQPSGVPYDAAYRFIHQHFPDIKDFEGVLAGLVKSKLIAYNRESGSLGPGTANKKPGVGNAPDSYTPL